MIDDFPCKVSAINPLYTGKAGYSKLRVDGAGIFGNKKRSTFFPTTEWLPVPIVKKLQDVRCVITKKGFRRVDSGVPKTCRACAATVYHKSGDGLSRKQESRNREKVRSRSYCTSTYRGTR